MIWMGFANQPGPGATPPPEPEDVAGDHASSSKPSPKPTSLFTDEVVDDDESLHASDLDNLDLPSARPSDADPAPDEGPEDFDDAVDPAAAEASMAYVAEHEDTGLPEPEAPPAAMEWIVPWIISLAAHAALVLIAVFVVWSVREAMQDEKIIIPIVSLSDTPGAPLEVKVQQRVETPAPAAAAAPAPAPTPLENDLDLELDLTLPGIGEPLAAAPTFELAIDDAAQFQTDFMGSGGNAKNIIFVLEADGSIIADYPQIVSELATTLRGMSEKQKFSVIVFDGAKDRQKKPIVKEVPPGGLQRATADAKAKAIAWLRDSRNVQTMGSGDAGKALQLAFKRRPELIFLLSQNLYNPGGGQYELQREDILDIVRNAPQRNLAINTIEFNDIDSLAFDPQGKKIRMTLLEEIAQITGGQYNWVVTNALDEGGF